MLAAAAMHRSNEHNTFLSMLDKTPELLSACIRLDKPNEDVDASSEDAGCLKTLRLVSQGARAAVSRAVTSFELTLNCKPGRDMSRKAHVLQGACLQRLRIRVMDTINRGSARKRAAGSHSECTS